MRILYAVFNKENQMEALEKMPDNTEARTSDSISVMANANINFNNTATINVAASANGATQTNVAFSVNTSAVSGGSGTPGGANTQLQYNNNSVFGGNANLTWNVESSLLSIDGNVRIANSGNLIFGGSQANTVANSHFAISWNVAASSLDFTFLG
jgi:hypothetical protein